MNSIKNVGIFAGGLKEGNIPQLSIANKGEEKGLNGKSVSWNQENALSDKIMQKRADARKKAAKIVSDQFANDRKIDDQIKDSENRITQLQDEIKEQNQEMQRIKKGIQTLKDSFGVTDEGEEQKNLEAAIRVQSDLKGSPFMDSEKNIIENAKKALETGVYGKASKEDLEMVASMESLTEYQNRALEADSSLNEFEKRIEKAKEAIGQESGMIRGIKKEMVKNTGMIKAEKASEEVIQSASDAIIGMILEDAKDHMDEEMEELVEKAEEEAEKKAEEEEKLQETKDTPENQEQPQEIVENQTNQKEIKQELQNIMRKEGLTEEDLKGIAVSAQV